MTVTNDYKLFLFQNPYILKHFYKFANLCLTDSSVYQEKTMTAINEVCGENFPQITETL